MNQEMINLNWPGMGTELQVVIGPSSEGYDNQDAAQAVKQMSIDFEKCLSRFDPESELSRLNQDPRQAVPASPLLRRAVSAALEAAEASGGLLDPTLTERLQDAGYQKSWDTSRRINLQEALRLHPQTAPANPAPEGRYREVEVGEDHITRPLGLQLEVGATGKGLCADIAAEMLGDRFPYWMVSIGGDLRSGGSEGLHQEVEIRHPLTDELIGELLLDGALATSGLSRRIWMQDGRPAHHLLDPSTGRPAFTGLIQVSAAAPTGLEAERIAGQALLSGPQAGARLLSRYGGIMVTSEGEAIDVEQASPVISARQLLEVYG